MGLDMYVIRKKKDIKTPIEDYEWWENDEIAYWRKANQIHNWFVNNIQNGNDDCGYYKVEKEDLQELVDICNRIKKEVKWTEGDILISKSTQYDKDTDRYTDIEKYRKGKVIENKELCEELLPTTSGFFFGSTEYDEWYMQDIEYTINRLQAIIDLLEWDLYDVYYGSSW